MHRRYILMGVLFFANNYFLYDFMNDYSVYSLFFLIVYFLFISLTRFVSMVTMAF